jgi:outer membrane protein assembly factor BamB
MIVSDCCRLFAVLLPFCIVSWAKTNSTDVAWINKVSLCNGNSCPSFAHWDKLSPWFFAPVDQGIAAVDKSNGNISWLTDIPYNTGATPTFVGTTTMYYVTEGREPAPPFTTLHARRAKNGSPVWEMTFPYFSTNEVLQASIPVAIGDVVTTSSQDVFSGGVSTLFYNATNNGPLLGQLGTGIANCNGINCRVAALPVLGLVVEPDSIGNLLAVNVMSRTVAWKTSGFGGMVVPLGEDGNYPPTRLLVLGTVHWPGLACVDTLSGAVLWQVPNPFGPAALGTIVVAGSDPSRAYLSARFGADRGYATSLAAVDARNGTVLWRYMPPVPYAAAGDSPPLPGVNNANGHVFFPSARSVDTCTDVVVTELGLDGEEVAGYAFESLGLAACVPWGESSTGQGLMILDVDSRHGIVHFSTGASLVAFRIRKLPRFLNTSRLRTVQNGAHVTAKRKAQMGKPAR